jgi:hypothetical protein
MEEEFRLRSIIPGIGTEDLNTIRAIGTALAQGGISARRITQLYIRCPRAIACLTKRSFSETAQQWQFLDGSRRGLVSQ